MYSSFFSSRASIAVIWLSISAVSLFTNLTAQPAIPVKEYAERREKILAAMDSNSFAIFLAATPDHRNGDVDFKFRQDNSLWYLTGFPEARAALLLSKATMMIDGKSTNEILFVRENNPMFATWTGTAIGMERAVNDYGLRASRSISALKSFMDSLLPNLKTLYYLPQTPAIVKDPVTGFQVNVDKEMRKDFTTRFPNVKMKSIGGSVAKLRAIKSEMEVQLIQKAIDATINAHSEAMKSCKPGMQEYELQAIIEYCFTKAGAAYTGFPSIVGSGPNSCVLHYEENRRTMRDGDVVVMDIGAEYEGYSADVTRTIPVNGKFSKEQREIYSIVLKAQEEAIKAIKPGVGFNEPHRIATKVIGDAGYGKYFMHGTSHHLGLDVHDVGGTGELKPGMVITVEPGIYIPEGSAIDKKYWNIGVRIEDDVLITNDGCIVLSAKAPRAIDEIEMLMKKEGIGNQPVGGR